jgi:hypothetical protein
MRLRSGDRPDRRRGQPIVDALEFHSRRLPSAGGVMQAHQTGARGDLGRRIVDRSRQLCGVLEVGERAPVVPVRLATTAAVKQGQRVDHVTADDRMTATLPRSRGTGRVCATARGGTIAP